MSSSDLPENMGPTMTSIRPGVVGVITEPLLRGYLAILTLFAGGVSVDFRSVFICCGEVVVLQGFFEKSGCSVWCFCGEFVVGCVAKVVD
jgi:hypothetical protein